MSLKSRYGNGYVLKFQFNPDHLDSVTQFVSKRIPSAVLEETMTGQVNYRISGGDLDMGEVLKSLLEHKEETHIDDWGITATSLDEVFLAVVRRDEEAEQMGKK
jgi:hypothetical protein